jgi:hypothetical protein
MAFSGVRRNLLGGESACDVVTSVMTQPPDGLGQYRGKALEYFRGSAEISQSATLPAGEFPRTRGSAVGYLRDLMAERVGFEPTVEFPQHTLSKRAP